VWQGWQRQLWHVEVQQQIDLLQYHMAMVWLLLLLLLLGGGGGCVRTLVDILDRGDQG